MSKFLEPVNLLLYVSKGNKVADGIKAVNQLTQRWGDYPGILDPMLSKVPLKMKEKDKGESQSNIMWK